MSGGGFGELLRHCPVFATSGTWSSRWIHGWASRSCFGENDSAEKEVDSSVMPWLLVNAESWRVVLEGTWKGERVWHGNSPHLSIRHPRYRFQVCHKLALGFRTNHGIALNVSFLCAAKSLSQVIIKVELSVVATGWWAFISQLCYLPAVWPRVSPHALQGKPGE